MLVALAEEGWVDGPIARGIVRRYLDESHAVSPDTIILGCTHFPLLTDTIRDVASDRVQIVDSAGTTAAVVRATMDATGTRRESDDAGTLRLLATDGARRFARVGGRFLGHALSPEDVELVDL